jgi:hypothetical protein
MSEETAFESVPAIRTPDGRLFTDEAEARAHIEKLHLMPKIEKYVQMAGLKLRASSTATNAILGFIRWSRAGYPEHVADALPVQPEPKKRAPRKSKTNPGAPVLTTEPATADPAE